MIFVIVLVYENDAKSNLILDKSSLSLKFPRLNSKYVINFWQFPEF